MESYSQIGQDLEVLKFYNNKKDGFFVEIGASDGINLSNTYLLEKNYNWKGICVEPIPKNFNLLCKNRPNSLCCDNAVYNESNMDVIFDIANNYDLLSGIANNIDCHKTAVDKNKTQITVKTITLNDLLEKYNAPLLIDYLSLDTEGSELEILKFFDFNKYIFGLIDIEHNFVEPRRTQIRELLTSNGYDYIKENNFDDCYKHKSINSKFHIDSLTIFNNSFNDILSNPEKNTNNNFYDNFYNNGIELLLKYAENIAIREGVLNKMIFVFPDKYELYYYMGYIYKDIDKSKALLWFKLCYEKNPKYIENFLDFSRILFDNRFFSYILFLNKEHFLELSDDKRTQLLYANLQLQSGKLLLAKKTFLDILKKNDNDYHKRCTVYLNLAAIYNKFNDFHNCLSYLKKSYKCAYTNNLETFFKKGIITDIFLAIDYIYYQKSDFNIFYESLLSSGNINEIYGESNRYDFTNRNNNRLKIGYISSDFFNHAVSNFILPIIENHSYEKMDIYLFSNSKTSDNFNSFLEKVPACHYVDIFLKDAKNVADIIYNNGIDILIDLNGHTAYNSLEVFTFNPAPIQMTYIGFPNSTHIPSIKYRIIDRIADNCDSLQKYSEQRIYLPKCFLLFDSVIQKEPINYRKCMADDFIILGSLNRENKNSPECLNVWRKILKENKRTKILIKINGNDTVEERTAYYLEKLELNDDASRLIIVDKVSDEDYIQLFYKIDILLDTFPYSGTTTSCNALYNSVPVISLYHKDYHSHNVTSSFLINSGMSELVAYNEDEYIQKIIQLSTNPEIINEYKRKIHTLFMKLMDKKEFMKSYEDLLINIVH